MSGPNVPGHAAVTNDDGRLSRAFADFLRKLAESAAVVGDYRQSARTDLGDGWLACDGSFVSNSLYPDLSALIMQRTGGTGSQFRLPTIDDVYDPNDTARVAPIMRTWIKAR